jgi:hypothetical protein
MPTSPADFFFADLYDIHTSLLCITLYLKQLSLLHPNASLSVEVIIVVFVVVLITIIIIIIIHVSFPCPHRETSVDAVGSQFNAFCSNI